MTRDYLVFVGTYTEPILFGTGKILEGKGEGIYAYRMDPESGIMELIHTNTGITNPSYLAFSSNNSYLYAVNELKMYHGKPTGTVSAFAVNTSTGQLTLHQFQNRSLNSSLRCCAMTTATWEFPPPAVVVVLAAAAILPAGDDEGVEGEVKWAEMGLA